MPLNSQDFAELEADCWAAMRLDLVSDGGSPEEFAPVDRAYIQTLIRAAVERVEGLTQPMEDFVDGVPEQISARSCSTFPQTTSAARIPRCLTSTAP